MTIQITVYGRKNCQPCYATRRRLDAAGFQVGDIHDRRLTYRVPSGEQFTVTVSKSRSGRIDLTAADREDRS